MNKTLLFHAALMLCGTFISSVAQVLLKKAAQQEYDSVWKEYLNARVIAGYAIFFAASFLSILAFRVVPLSMGPILEATGYLYVTIFGSLIFKEKITGQKIAALVLILAGISVSALLG